MKPAAISSLQPWVAAGLLIVLATAVPALGGTPPAAGVSGVAPPVDIVILGRAVYVGLMLLTMGVAWFLLLIPVPAAITVFLRRLLAAGAVGGLLVGAFNVQQLNLLAVAGFGLLLAASWREHWALLLGGALALATSRALIGHPASLEPAAVLMPLMILHVSCAAYWLGSLWPLHRVLGREAPVAAAAVVNRFSRLAVAAVGTLALVGVVTALIHLAWPIALLKTWYGQLLIMKFTWFTVLMSVAAWHKLKLSPRLDAGDVGAARHMRWGIRLEGAIMLLVVLLSALLASTPPAALPP